MDPYFQYFSSVSSEIIITKWETDTTKNLYNTINSRREFT
jgi:hypothetical protein